MFHVAAMTKLHGIPQFPNSLTPQFSNSPIPQFPNSLIPQIRYDRSVVAPQHPDAPEPRAYHAARHVSAASGVAAVVLLVIGVAISMAMVREGDVRRAMASTTPTIAVLPVDTPPGTLNANLAELGPVFTDAIVARLSTLAGTRAKVLSRPDTEALHGDDRTLAGVRALGADYLVDVSMRPTAAGSVRVHATLVNVSGGILWTADYDISPADLADVDTIIAPGIARRVADALVPAARRRAELLTPRVQEITAASRSWPEFASRVWPVTSSPGAPRPRGRVRR